MMIKNALFGIAMSVAIVFGASASEKIAKFNIDNQKISTNVERSWKSSKFIRSVDETATATPGVTLGPAEDYSMLTGPDGTQWYSTQTYTKQNYYYSGSSITIYNNKGEKQGEVNVTIPEGENVNQIMVGNIVSTSLFDKNTNTLEIPVITHTIHSPGVTSHTTRIYDVASGELKQSYEGLMSIVDYYTGFRTEWLGVLSTDTIVDGLASVRYDIYAKPGYSSETATLKKTFTAPKSLAEYQIGSVLNIFIIDHKPYYVMSAYEKEYLDPASYEEPWDMIPTADNNFVATVYDQYFNEKGSVKIPVTSTSQYLIQFGIGLFGEQDLSQGYWDESGDMQLVVTSTGFDLVSKAEDFSFDVYDLNGNHVKNIASNIGNWMKMYDIPGEPVQMAFLSAEGDAITMVDLPECTTAATFGSEIEGEAISTNIDRYTAGAGYQYVIALPAPEVTDDNSFVQRLAWVTTEGEITKQVKFNLGQSNASWIPLVMGEVLNPYVFDTDDQREYVFIANQYASGTSGQIINDLRIVKEDGTLVRSYTEDSEKGDLGTCNVMGFYDGCPVIIVPFMNSETDLCTVEIDFLPFNSFSAGGDGSAANPYLIASIGDMAQMQHDLTANYKIINNFDASEYGAWQPTGRFCGNLDGGNHTISNLVIEGNTTYPSLFAETENATISNIKFNSPEINASADASSVGIVAANAIASTFSNIHIYNGIITGADNTYATIGTIVGDAALSSTISECYAYNLTLDAPSASPVGGIVGYTRTSSTVNACAVSGNISGSTTIGGIVGEASTACSVLNCHTNVNITGKNNIGGIVGSANRGGIHACIAEGSLTATKTDINGYIRTGGIAGSLAAIYSSKTDEENEDESTMDTETAPWNGKVISNNVVNLSSLTAEGKAAHRIIGYSRCDEDSEAQKYDSSVVITMDPDIDKNFALNPQSPVDENISAEANNIEGATIAHGNFTADFLKSIDFAFGITVDAPWLETEYGTFALYFEKVEQSSIKDINSDNNTITINGDILSAGENAKIELYNLTGMKVAEGHGQISVANIVQGIYVAKITDACSGKYAQKIAIK